MVALSISRPLAPKRARRRRLTGSGAAHAGRAAGIDAGVMHCREEAMPERANPVHLVYWARLGQTTMEASLSAKTSGFVTDPCDARRGRHCRRRRGARLGWCGLAWLVFAGNADAVPSFDPGYATFVVRVQDDVIPYRVFAIYALPGETLHIEVDPAPPDRHYRLVHTAGELSCESERRWCWRTPPEPGVQGIRIEDRVSGDSVRLNVFVMYPATEAREGLINGYRLGQYPERALHHEPVYLPPQGFIELTEDNRDTELSPHFTLAQFPCKQTGEAPKYLVLRERLLLKLELLLQRLNEAGHRVSTFTVMSGYRTPWYNASIGNVRYSRHVYGGAADIYIDEHPRDGIMDDLDGNGKADFRDAQLLYRLANELFARPEHAALTGGLGVYRSTRSHGPFLHVDARGVRARWGLVPDTGRRVSSGP